MPAHPTAPGTGALPAGDPPLSLDEARAAIAAMLVPLADGHKPVPPAGQKPVPPAGDEPVPLLQALGRVLAADVISPVAVPAHDNSAMDGYAFDGTALRAEADTVLRKVSGAGSVLAGRPYTGSVAGHECVRIMTGAVMPAGADTVVPLELCRVEGDRVCIAAGVLRPGDNRRLAGEDLALGQPALRAGRVLRPADMGLAASVGIAQLRVRPRLRVAVFSTGDELRTAGQLLDPGCIYDSNRYSLMAALQRLGAEVVDMGLVRDEPAALQAALEAAIAQADVVVTSGGVSAGDADHTRALLARMGEVRFWQVAMRPGRPFACGPVAAGGRRAWLFALPGNPVAALVSFYALVRDAVLQLAGATPAPLPVLQARSAQAIPKRPGRTEMQRARLVPLPGGGWQAALTGAQGSGILRSMSEADGLLVLAHEQGPVAAGEWVDVWLFDGLV